MSESLPAPKNRLVDLINAVITTLIQGLGVDAATAAGIGLFPWLAYPFVNQIYSWVVKSLSESITTTVKSYLDNLIIAAQYRARQAAYEEAKAEMIKALAQQGVTSDAAKKAADEMRKAIDRLVQKNRTTNPRARVIYFGREF